MMILFDECVSLKATRSIRSVCELHANDIRVAHLSEIMDSGIKDDELVEKMTKMDSTPIFVSMDLGRKTSSFEPAIHRLAPRFGITAIFLSAAFSRMNKFDIARSLSYLLPEIVAAGNETPGSRFKVTPNQKSSFSFSAWGS